MKCFSCGASFEHSLIDNTSYEYKGRVFCRSCLTGVKRNGFCLPYTVRTTRIDSCLLDEGENMVGPFPLSKSVVLQIADSDPFVRRDVIISYAVSKKLIDKVI